MLRLSPIALVLALSHVAPGVAQEWAGRARVDGQVTDEAGSALSGAAVSMRTPEGEAGPEVTSGTDGRFVIDGVAAGSWVLEITAPGHRAQRIGVHLPDESSWLGPLDVQLASVRTEPDPPPLEAVPEENAPPGQAKARGGYSDVRLALATGRSDRALELAAALPPTDSGSAELFVEIGRGFLIAGETAEAIAFFDRALEQEPEHVGAHYERALGLLALGRHGEAREDLEAVRDLRPDSALGAKAGQALEELTPWTETEEAR
jgi:hypothetical protein